MRVVCRRRLILFLIVFLFSSLVSAIAPQRVNAATITPLAGDETGAASLLVQTMMSDTSNVLSASFVTIPARGTPYGLVSGSLSVFPTHGQNFAVLTTGDAALADEENTSSSSGADLGGESQRGGTAYDVTILRIDFRPPAFTNCLKFDFAFYSEEYPEYVGDEFNDAFIAELDVNDWTASTTIDAPHNFAFDINGNEVSINAAGLNMTADNANGTTYDGATTLLEAATPFTPGTDHALYLSLFDQADHSYDSAAFVDNIRFEQVTDPANCKRGAAPKNDAPLIYVPGMTGSVLSNLNGVVWADGGKLWSEDFDEHLLPLQLAEDGLSPLHPEDPAYATVEATDILREVGTPLWDIPIYSYLIERLKTAGYEEGENFFVFQFDWRKSAQHNANLLLDFIEQVRSQTGADKVDILAHSMGGAVTRTALSNSASVGKIRRILLLGSAVAGALKSYGLLVYGSPCMITEFLGSCLINSGTVGTIAKNMSGLYDMLPSQAYDNLIGVPINVDYDKDLDGHIEGPLTYSQWTQALISEHYNATLLSRAKSYHAQTDILTLADPSVVLYHVIGDGLDTLSRSREYINCFMVIANCGPWNVDIEFLMGPGDGTVPRSSASLYNPDNGTDLRRNVTNLYVKGVNHIGLTQEDVVIDYILSFFGANPQAQAKSMAMSAMNEDAISLPAISDSPQPFGGIELETLGPVQGYVMDSAQRIVGRRPDVAQDVISLELPGSDYNSARNTQSFFLNFDGSYEGRLTATATAPLRFRMRSYSNDHLEGQAVFTLLAAQGEEYRIAFTKGQDLNTLVLQVDRNGDGTIDTTIRPDSVIVGPGADDHAAPTTTATFELVSAGQARVTLTGKDDLSGIAGTYYAVGINATKLELYQGSFVVPVGTHIRYASVDRAGNTEFIKDIVAQVNSDDAPNSRLTAAPMDLGVKLERFINPPGDEDWFSFTADGRSTYKIELDGLVQDYDLEIYDAQGRRVLFSAQRGKESEKVNALLPSGQYFIRVSGYNGAWDAKHPYHLKLQTLGK